MKRIIALVLAAILSVAVFAGCGSSGDSAKNVDLASVMETINSANKLSLEKVEGKDMLNRYYNIDEKDVKQFAAEKDSDPDAPLEVVLVEAVDADAAGRVEAALKDRYDSVLRTYTSYTPEKVAMVKECKVTKDGNFVSLIIADNSSNMLKTYQEKLK